MQDLHAHFDFEWNIFLKLMSWDFSRVQIWISMSINTHFESESNDCFKIQEIFWMFWLNQFCNTDSRFEAYMKDMEHGKDQLIHVGDEICETAFNYCTWMSSLQEEYIKRICTPRVDNHVQAWQSCYVMAWTWCFTISIAWSWLFHDMLVMVVIENTKIVASSSWKTPWPCYGDHGLVYNVLWTLIIQLTSLISGQVVVHYFSTKNMLE